MTTKLSFGRDVQGYNAYAPPFGDDGSQCVLAANTAQSVTVPSNFTNWIAVFSYSPGSNVWVANNVTATVPTGAFSSTTSKLLPASRTVSAGDVISFITSDTDSPQVGVIFYAL